MSTDTGAAEKGRRAKLELDQTAEAFAGIKTAVTAKMVACPPEREATILKLHMVLHILDSVEKALLECVVNGQTAEAALAIADLTRP